MKKFDPYKDRPYSGNAEDQARIIKIVTDSALNGHAGLHIIGGCTGTGKSYTVGKIDDNIIGQLELVATQDDIFSGKLPTNIPENLAKTLKIVMADSHNPHSVYKHPTKNAFVIVTDDELSLIKPSDISEIGQIAKLIDEAKAQGIAINWIIDTAIIGQAASIFVPTPKAKKFKKDHNNNLNNLIKEFPETIHSHSLNYDTKTIRESVWSHIAEYGQYHLKDDGHSDNTVEWKTTLKAALSGDRTAYDRAFDVLEKRAKAIDLPPRS